MTPKELAIRNLLSRVPYVQVKTVQTWLMLNSVASVATDSLVMEKAAAEFTRQFSTHVLHKRLGRFLSHPEGQSFEMIGYCLTYDELIELMSDAYNLNH